MLKSKRFVFMVLIISFISVFSTAALALTAREEKLIDICKRYEDWFASHSRSYGRTMPMGAGHLKFTCYRVPQRKREKQFKADGSETEIWVGLIAEIKSSGWLNNELDMRLHTEDSEDGFISYPSIPTTGLSFAAHNSLDGNTAGFFDYQSNIISRKLIRYGTQSTKDARAEVSESSPNAGTARQIAGSLWNFGSWVTDIDDGAFVVIKNSDGSRAFFKTDCTECANIMTRFLNDIFPVMASE